MTSKSSALTFMGAIEKTANDPLQVLGTQKKVSFDETINVKENVTPPPPPQATATTATTSSKITVDRDNGIGPADIVVSSPDQGTANLATETTATAPETANQHGSLEGSVKPMKNDILSGRGAGVNLHPGNVFFRSLIQDNKAAYIAADPGEKKRIIKRLVTTAYQNGRFMKQDPKTELWVPISVDEAKRKTGQALRENAPAIKKQQDTKILLQVSNQQKPVEQKFLPSIRAEIETPKLISPTSSLNQMASSYVSPPVMPPSHPAQLSTAHLLWSRMNTLSEKQEQLKRKQRELEDEQSQLMHFFYQMTSLTSPMATPLDFLYGTATSDSGSDSETDQIYNQGHSKRRRINTRH